MAKNLRSTPNVRDVLGAEKLQHALEDLTSYILERFDFSFDNVVLVGIQTRGVILANRLAKRIKEKKGHELPVGALDITLYRDDFSTSGIQPRVGETHLNFDIDDKQVVLIDDVLFTGRTIRAALDELMDFGRPKTITLVVLVDRGHRELPIAPDFASIKIPTKRTESVNLFLSEVDEKDEIVVYEAGPS